MITYASFLFPINLRRTRAPHLWALLCQLERIDCEKVVYIGSKDYFSPDIAKESRWEFKRWSTGVRKRLLVKNKVIVPDSLISSAIYNNELLDNRVWGRLVIDEIPELINYFIEIFSGYSNLQVVFTLCNCKSLKVACDKLGLKVMHFELGALRSPNYIDTAYLDFTGVNGSTSSEEMYRRFMQTSNEIELCSRQELFNFICKRYSFSELKTFKEKYRLGVPLQVEDDSNMLFYSNGFNNFELLEYANSHVANCLVRTHPLGHAIYTRVGDLDKSPNSLEFICKCSEIVSINSSVGFEALLIGKDVKMFGDNPISFFINRNENDENTLTVFLNFFALCYLIPFDLLFDQAYTDWRLTNPTEVEIYTHHKNHYRDNDVGNLEVGKKERIRRALIKFGSYFK